MQRTANRTSDPGRQKPICRSARRLVWLALALTMAGVWLTIPAQTQQQPTMGPSSMIQTQPAPLSVPSAPADSVFQERRMRAMNAERQKEMVSDTAKLLKLTAALNAEVNRDKSDSFTPEQLRQLAKIEKLARSVREKMANPVQTSLFEDNFLPPAILPMGIP
ncbi:MAG: hypothetical protein ACRD3N_17775 [Terracidiphilus sp.]